MKKSRSVDPLLIFNELPDKLMSGEEQESHDSSFFDRASGLSLLASRKTGVSSRFDLSVVTGDMSKQRKVFVVHVVNAFECFSGRFDSHIEG
jgi:hypothetical protein